MLKRKLGGKLKNKRVVARKKKLACALRLKLNFAAKRKKNGATKKLSAAGPNTSESWRKKSLEPPRNLNFLLKSNDLKLKSRHQRMRRIPRLRRSSNGLK